MSLLSRIKVTSYDDAQALVGTPRTSREIGYVLSLLSPNLRPLDIPSDFRGETLVLRFDDVEVPHGASIAAGYVPVREQQISALLQFLLWSAHGSGHILIHCTQGIARSTAAALILLYSRLEERPHGVFAGEALLKIAPQASPNRLMIRYADEAFAANGKLIAISEEIHRHQANY